MTDYVEVAERAAGVRFGLVELDLLATYAKASIPFPLKVPSFGRIPGERDVLFATAGATLRHRGLADEDGPVGLGRDLVDALASRTGTIDLMLSGSGAPVGVVAIVHRNRVLLCRQTLSDAPTELVEVRRVSSDGLVDALVEAIPRLAGAKTMPVRIPTEALRAVHHERAHGSQLYGIASRYGCSVDELAALISAEESVIGSGQLGATVPSKRGKDVRVGSELSWLDGPAGRLRISGQNDWMSVNPLHPNDLRTAIQNLVALVRR